MFTIGVDFGTESVRSSIFSVVDGQELVSCSSPYRRFSKGLYCDPLTNKYRHHPQDYLDSFILSIRNSLGKLPKNIPHNIVGIGIDTTGSTVAPIDSEGRVLSLKSNFKENPDAMFNLWKDHTAITEAEEIIETAKKWSKNDFLKYSGRYYSSEWFWAKILHNLKNDVNVRREAFSWVELCDWIPAVLTGNIKPNLIKRSRCIAGHKACWSSDWNGLPADEFLRAINPILGNLKNRLYKKTHTSDEAAGHLNDFWASKLGLPKGITVSVGILDAHAGAIGSGIKPGTLCVILGTSAVYLAVTTPEEINDRIIKGICGQVEGAIIPGKIGIEAGQSSFGDVYNWFKNLLLWPTKNIISKTQLLSKRKSFRLINEIEHNLLNSLNLFPNNTMNNVPLSTDWLNGRNCPFTNEKLKGTIMDITIGIQAEHIFQSLVEATAFGSKAIIDNLISEGIIIKKIIASGGITKKSQFVMQTLCDVLQAPIDVIRTDQACALGAAINAAVSGGAYNTVEDAQNCMSSDIVKTYYPDKSRIEYHRLKYSRYQNLG